MSATRDMWSGPAWAFQSKPDARFDLLGVTDFWQGSGDNLIFDPGVGDLFYVDGTNGSDANVGTDIDHPFATITKAVSVCTANKHDVVYVLSYPAAGNSGETWPIVVDKATTSIIGRMRGGRPAAWISAARAGEDTDAINVTASYVTLKNLEIGGDTGDLCVQITAGVTGTRIEGCWIGASSVCDDAQYGIGLSGDGDAPHTLILNNTFGPYLTGAGIYMPGQKNMTRGFIVGNTFRKCGTYAMYFSGDGLDIGGIMHNVVEADADDTTGYALYMSGTGNANTLIVGNRCYYSTQVMRYAPFYIQTQGSTVTVMDNKHISDDVQLAAIRREIPASVTGRIVYVDGTNGSNNNSGLTPQDPVLTITEALSLCTTAKGDCIYILSYPAASATGEVFPITIAHNNLHIIGHFSGGRPTAWISAGRAESDTAVFDLTAGISHVHLKNLALGGGNAHGAIEITGTGNITGLKVERCWIGADGTALGAQQGNYGIYTVAPNDMPHLEVVDCIFGPYIDTACISIHNFTRGYIGMPGHGNIFRTGDDIYGIIVTGAGADFGGILDNRFSTVDGSLTAGVCITLPAGGCATAGNCLVDGNHAAAGKVAVGTELFLDAAADASGGNWGLNYYDIAAQLPA